MLILGNTLSEYSLAMLFGVVTSFLILDNLIKVSRKVCLVEANSFCSLSIVSKALSSSDFSWSISLILDFLLETPYNTY